MSRLTGPIKVKTKAKILNCFFSSGHSPRNAQSSNSLARDEIGSVKIETNCLSVSVASNCRAPFGQERDFWGRERSNEKGPGNKGSSHDPL